MVFLVFISHPLSGLSSTLLPWHTLPMNWMLGLVLQLAVVASMSGRVLLFLRLAPAHAPNGNGNPLQARGAGVFRVVVHFLEAIAERRWVTVKRQMDQLTTQFLLPYFNLLVPLGARTVLVSMLMAFVAFKWLDIPLVTQFIQNFHIDADKALVSATYSGL